MVGTMLELFPNMGLLVPMEDRSSMEPPPDPFRLSVRVDVKIWVVEDVYDDPERAREFPLSLDFEGHPERHKGERTEEESIPEPFQELFELVTRAKVGHGYAVWQLNKAGDQLVYHSDQQRWAAALYMTPNAPPSAGTSFYRSRAVPRVRSSSDLHAIVGDVVPTIFEAEALVYGGALLDRTRWDEVDRIGNVFNRLVIWRADLVHAVSEVFGHNAETARLVQLFFWDDAK